MSILKTLMKIMNNVSNHTPEKCGQNKPKKRVFGTKPGSRQKRVNATQSESKKDPKSLFAWTMKKALNL